MRSDSWATHDCWRSCPEADCSAPLKMELNRVVPARRRLRDDAAVLLDPLREALREISRDELVEDSPCVLPP